MIRSSEASFFLPFTFFLVVFALFAQADPPLEVVSPESLNLNSEAFAPIDGWVRKLIEAENDAENGTEDGTENEEDQ